MYSLLKYYYYCYYYCYRQSNQATVPSLPVTPMILLICLKTSVLSHSLPLPPTLSKSPSSSHPLHPKTPPDCILLGYKYSHFGMYCYCYTFRGGVRIWEFGVWSFWVHPWFSWITSLQNCSEKVSWRAGILPFAIHADNRGTGWYNIWTFVFSSMMPMCT